MVIVICQLDYSLIQAILRSNKIVLNSKPCGQYSNHIYSLNNLKYVNNANYINTTFSKKYIYKHIVSISTQQKVEVSFFAYKYLIRTKEVLEGHADFQKITQWFTRIR